MSRKKHINYIVPISPYQSIDYSRVNLLSKEEQLKSVKQYSYVINFIINPCKEIQLAAVKQNGLAIQYIDNPSKEVQLEAIKQCPYILDNINYYIKNPCQEVLDLAMIKDIIE